MPTAPPPDRGGRVRRCHRVAHDNPPGSGGGVSRLTAWPIAALSPGLSEPSKWRFAIVSVASTGRIQLPAAARDALDVAAGGTVRAVSRGERLVLRPGGGRRIAVDGRARLTLPTSLRHAAAPARSVLVAARVDAPLVVVMPVGAIDTLVDDLQPRP